MMKWTENMAVKALAFIVAVAAFAAAAIMGWYQAANFEVIWGDYGPGDGYTITYMQRRDCQNIAYLLNLYNWESLGSSLDAFQIQEKARLESELLDTAVTNLRWQAADREGNVRFGNAEGAVPVPAQGLYTSDFSWATASYSVSTFWGIWQDAAKNAVNVTGTDNVVYSEEWQSVLYEKSELMEQGTAEQTTEKELDAVWLYPDGTTEVLTVETAEGTHVYGPTIRSIREVNEFGYIYLNGWWQQEDYGEKVSESLDLTLWLDSRMAADDQYKDAYVTLREWNSNRGLLLAVTIGLTLLGLLLTVYLCAVCGHKRGRDGITLNWFHRIPGDLLLAVLFFAGLLAVLLFFDSPIYGLFYSIYGEMPMYLQLLFVGSFIAVLAALVMAALITFTARCKAGTVLKNTLIWKLCRWIWRLLLRFRYFCVGVAEALPLVWKAALLIMAYVVVTVLTIYRFSGLWLLVTAVAAGYLCLWAYQWKRIRQGTQEIIGGNPDYHIDTSRMLPDLRKHADELNNLGQSISAAVDDRMKSEHFKTELITNVSHDLKTPLTSIINYVDLLKKEDISDPTVREYIDVLDRKSQRLKKLTEDLMEASKASTGNLTVVRERIGLTQLADQALAEYEDRLEGKGLKVVRTFPEEEVWVEADGRHLWRVLDNLLSNCAKYALEGTRVYVEIRRFPEQVALSVKNISRDPLNVPPEALMERFVRGDESRTTEGSGLGLSITQSLTELQKGKFDISIDGDLFKATVTLPLAEEE